MPTPLVQNAPVRSEYNEALRELEPVLHDLPPKIIIIDRFPCSGKTTLGRFLAWRFNISLVETDLFLIRNQGSFIYRNRDIRAVIEHRIQSDRPIIIEGVVALKILNDVGYDSSFHIRVCCDETADEAASDTSWQEYLTSYKPRADASLMLDIPANE